MSKRLALIPIGLFVVWCVVCQQWYVCHIKQACGATPVLPPPVQIDTAVDTRPIVFAWSAEEPETRPSWGAFRDSILNALGDGKLLEITGLYAEEEKTPTGFANMGLARSSMVKSLLLEQAKTLNPELITVTSRVVDSGNLSKTKKFVAASFAIKDQPKDDVVEIVEVDNTITILFPYAKSTKEPDPRVDEYLEKLATRLAKTDETVVITGHTDGAGTVAYNQELGLARAKHIQDILISKGISKGRLSIESKGELMPVADNSTEEGSRLNRRAVLVLHKKEST
ncbi:MAG: OmpA family protein [Saprospiraceae bacterium]|nr:OmpA family protein [Saprospiraceae bacterium]